MQRRRGERRGAIPCGNYSNSFSHRPPTRGAEATLRPSDE